MDLDMEKSKIIMGGLGSPVGNSGVQQLPFPVVDLAAFAPFAVGFPAAAFPAAVFQNALGASAGTVAPMVAMPPVYDLQAFASPFVCPSTGSAPASQMAESIGSPDLPFVASDELLSLDLESPASTAASLTSPIQMAPTPAPSMAQAAGGKVKKKKRKPKPRMADLSEAEAQAKRDSNRESARKSRDRKRERERSALDENEKLKKEVAELKLKVQVLSDLLLEKGSLL